MTQIDRGNVRVELRDVYSKLINDRVEIAFTPIGSQSLRQTFTHETDGSVMVLEGIPAGAWGINRVLIEPQKYRRKEIPGFRVIKGNDNLLEATFLLHAKSAEARGIDFADIASKSYGNRLLRILDASEISPAAWDGLEKRVRASVFNISAKMARKTTPDGAPIVDRVNSIERSLLIPEKQERIYARVDPSLLTQLRDSGDFKSVIGQHHKFPVGWNHVSGPNSFKSGEDGGNIQLTFAENSDGNLLADIDLDDSAGVQHVADVLRHTITQKNTDPYDIHQILLYVLDDNGKNVDPEYSLI